MTKPYYVYWLHLENHTDILTEGYVGITSLTPELRFTAHVKKTMKSPVFNVHKAMLKYGVENIKITTICLTDSAHARWMEKSLRPDPFIGWNMQRGGIGNPYLTEEQKKASASKAAKTKRSRGVDLSGVNHPNWKGGVSDGYKRKNGLFVKKSPEHISTMRSENIKKFVEENGYFPTQHPDFRQKASESHKRRFAENGPWVNSQANIPMWLQAGYIFVLRQTVALPRSLIAEIVGFKAASISNITDRFHHGWNPLEDTKWIQFYEQSKTTSHPPIEELILQVKNSQC